MLYTCLGDDAHPSGGFDRQPYVSGPMSGNWNGVGSSRLVSWAAWEGVPCRGGRMEG